MCLEESVTYVLEHSQPQRVRGSLSSVKHFPGKKDWLFFMENIEEENEVDWYPHKPMDFGVRRG
jgi:hypothetical protein